MNRRRYIDWLRGVAVLIMILWHSMDAWTRLDHRGGPTFAWIAFIAGWAAPMFLFLAGVSVALAGASSVARGVDRATASWTLQKRGWQIFLLAHVFRFQGFLLNPNGSWNGLLKPDILNILGLGIVAAACCWGKARTTRAAWLWLAIPTLLIVACLTPWSRQWWWPTLLHPRLEAYFRPVANYGVFSIFPAVAYVFAGAYLGTRMAATAAQDLKFHLRLALVGLALLATSAVASVTPSLFGTRWADSIALFTLRVGGMTAALAASWFLLRGRESARWSPLVVFGQTSLFVYWVHVEMAYGVFTYSLRHSLTLPVALMAYLLFTIAMLGLAALWQKRGPVAPYIPRHMRAREA